MGCKLQLRQRCAQLFESSKGGASGQGLWRTEADRPIVCNAGSGGTRWMIIEPACAHYSGPRGCCE
jgi:hypothetical protein